MTYIFPGAGTVEKVESEVGDQLDPVRPDDPAIARLCRHLLHAREQPRERPIKERHRRDRPAHSIGRHPYIGNGEEPAVRSEQRQNPCEKRISF